MKLSEFKTLDKLEDEMFLDSKKQINIPYKAFVPSKVNHKWDFNDIQHTLDLAEEVMQVITRLDERINSLADAGIINQEAIIRMIANKESNESSVIEGTQTMIEDAFSNIKLLAPEKRENAEELQNYIKALDYGIDNLSKIPLSEDKEPGKLPLSERLIKSIHEKLMNGVRGARKIPGEFKDKQNYIGQNEADDISKAIFIPPHPKHTTDLMKDLFELANQESYRQSHKLIVIALIHYQFETIHPFNDGNGRTARLLTTLILHLNGYDMKGIYSLEEYYAKDLGSYYQALTVGEHNYYTNRATEDITKWVEYFCKGMMRAFESVRKNIESQVGDTETQDKSRLLYELDARQKRTLELFMKQKTIKAADIGLILGISTRAANNLCKTWIEQGFITPTHGGKRGRGYILGEKFEELVV